MAGGAEAAIHVARKFVQNMKPAEVLVKMDFANAFNTLRRDAMLEAVYRCFPEIYNFCYLSYASHSNLLCHERIIFSQEGPQQGDSFGATAFQSSYPSSFVETE